MKNSRGILLLLAVFAILVVLILTQNNNQSALPIPTQAPTAVVESGSLIRAFPDLTVLDIQAIRLENVATSDQVTLVRDADGLWTAPDLAGDLDGDRASEIARTLVLFPYARSLNILEDTDFDDYGFASGPQLLFHILKTDDKSHTIAIGDLTESALSYYSLIDERDEIYQIERGPVDFLRNFIASPPVA